MHRKNIIEVKYLSALSDMCKFVARFIECLL